MQKWQLTVDTWTSYGKQWFRIKIKHIPTGITVEGEGKFKNTLKQKLLAKLNEEIKNAINSPIEVGH